MKPAELLHDLAVSCIIFNGRMFPVGSLILRQPESKRDLLKKLKSSDIENVRWLR